MAIPFLACMAAAAAFYHLPPRVLPSIQAVEGGSVGSISRNADGSYDLGLMQVNTLWVNPIAVTIRMNPDTVRFRLVYDPCFNIAAAAAVLRTYLIETHFNLMLAIGNYHSHTPALNRAYQTQVLGAAGRLFGR